MINWHIVDREWESNGTMRADKAIWYLLGEYEPISGVSGCEEKWERRGGEFSSLKEALFIAGAIVDYEIARKRINYTRDSFGQTQAETLSEKRESVCLAHKDRLLAFYEENRALGRPPFLYEDERDICGDQIEIGNATQEPLQRQRWQENEIVRVIGELGYTATALPKQHTGRRWVKAEVKEMLTGCEWQGGIFNAAWKRLRADGRIAEK